MVIGKSRACADGWTEVKKMRVETLSQAARDLPNMERALERAAQVRSLINFRNSIRASLLSTSGSPAYFLLTALTFLLLPPAEISARQGASILGECVKSDKAGHIEQITTRLGEKFSGNSPPVEK